MSYENLKKQSVEPLVLLDLQYDAMDKFISDFEDTLPGSFHFSKNIELDKTTEWSGNSSVKFDVGYDDIIIKDFEDEGDYTILGSASNLEREDDNYTQGTRCLKFTKTNTGTWCGLKTSSGVEGTYLADWKKYGILALNVYFESDADAQKITSAHLQFQSSTSGQWARFLPEQHGSFHAGWNVLTYDVARTADTLTSSFDENVSLDNILFEIQAGSSDVLDIRMDAFRIYNGPDCYIEETIEDFSDYTEWSSVSGYASVISEDTTNVRTGTSSVKIAKTSTSTKEAFAEKTYTEFDLSKSQILKISFYVPQADLSSLASCRIDVYKNNGNRKLWYFEGVKAGWNTAYINLAFCNVVTGNPYSYEYHNDIVKIQVGLICYNATDIISGVTFDSLLFPGDKANSVDLPVGLFNHSVLVSGSLSASNLEVVEDTTAMNSKTVLQFDKTTGDTKANINVAFLTSTNSNQCDIRHSMLMAVDWKASSSADEAKLDSFRIYRNSGNDFNIEQNISSNPDENETTDWSTCYFNVPVRHFKSSALDYFALSIITNNSTDTLTDFKMANLRTVKRDNKFYGKTQNTSLKEWNYSSGRWKPLYWEFAGESDFLSVSDHENIESNVRNYKDANTLRVNNTSSELWSMYQEKTNNQNGIPTAPADLLLYPNTDGDIELSALVYCKNEAVVRLKYRTSDMTGGTYLYSDRNTLTGAWERLSVKFQMDSYTDTIDYIGIEVVSGSGNVDICEPKLVPYRFGNRPDYFIVNRLDDTRNCHRERNLLYYVLFTPSTIINYLTKIETTEINHYNKYGITCTKSSSGTSAWFSFDWHGTLKKHQRILLDVYIKDSATLAKISNDIELHIARTVDKDRFADDQIILSKNKTNHNIRVGWNTLAWTVDQVTQDDTPRGDNTYGAVTPRLGRIRFDTVSSSSLSPGDIIFSNLRTFDGEPYKEIIQPTEDTTPSSGFDEWSTDKIFSGDGSWKFDSDQTTLTLTQIPVYMDLSDTEHIYFALYSDDWSNVASGTTTILLKTGSFDYFYLQPDFSLLVDGEWNLLKMKLSTGDRKDSAMIGEMFVSGNPKLSRITQVELRFYLTSKINTVVYFGGCFSDNFRELPYLGYTETSPYTIEGSSGTLTRKTDGGYQQQIYLEAAKTLETTNELKWNLDDTVCSLSFRDMKKVYQAVYVPSAAHSQITKFRMILCKDKSSVSGLYTSEVPISSIKADEWNVIEYDFSGEPEQPNDLMNIERIYFRIQTSRSTALFSGVKLGAITCECDKVFQGGIVSEFNDSLTNSNYIGFKLYVPDEETLANIDSVNLISSVNYDYSDSRFYKKDNTNFIVGWNDIKFHIEDDIEFDSKKTTTEDTNLIKNFKVYVKSANGFELNGIQIDRFATYNEDTDEVLRTSKIDIVGTENGKYWEGRLLKAGKITRKISEREGLVELPSSSFELADTDEKIAGIYSNLAGPSNFLKNEVNIRIGTEEDSESEFLQLSKTYISNIEFNKKKCTIKATDTLEPYLIDLPTELYLQEDFSNIDDGNNSKPASIIYGEVESNIGALPIINLGEYDTDTSAPYVLYGVAGHACKNGTGAVYHDKVPIDPSDSDFGYEFDYSYVVNNKTFCLIKVPMVEQTDATDSANNEWKNPWEEDITNIDSGGNDVEVSVAPENIAINIHGKTIDGSPYSTLMEDVTDCIYDLLTVHMGLPSSRINTTNFQDIQTLLTQNTQLMAGAIVESENAEETIADMLISHNIQMYPDKDGKISLYLFKAQKYDTESTLFTDEIDILANSFKCSTGVDNLINRIRYRCNFNYSNQYKDDNNSWEYNNLVSDEDSISRVGSIIDWEDDYLELKWLRDSSRADAIANRLLLRYKNGRPSATFSLPLEAFDKDLAERIRVTHYDGVSISKDKSDTVGWDAHLCNITDIEMDLDEYKLKVTVDNIQDLATNCAFLGDRDGDTVPAFTTLWADATETERTYLYLADRDGVYVTPGKMSDDSTDGKSLC